MIGDERFSGLDEKAISVIDGQVNILPQSAETRNPGAENGTVATVLTEKLCRSGTGS
jgi:hypothetical protein